MLILKATGEGIFGLNTRGRHTFLNPAAAKMQGSEAVEPLDRNSHATCNTMF